MSVTPPSWAGALETNSMEYGRAEGDAEDDDRDYEKERGKREKGRTEQERSGTSNRRVVWMAEEGSYAF